MVQRISFSTRKHKLLIALCAIFLFPVHCYTSPTKSIRRPPPVPLAKAEPPRPLQAWPLQKDPKGMAPDFPLATARVAATVASTLATLCAQTQYSNVLASSAVTLICSLSLDKRLGQAAMCGSFAGMCGTFLVPSLPYAILLGVLTSACFEILIHTKNAYLGIGGRLGATAFLATSTIAFLQNIPTGVSLSTISTSKAFGSRSTLLAMAGWHALGSCATIALREASDDNAASDPVRASAVVGLLAALLLEDKAAALALYGGSFVGMSLPSRLMHGIVPGKEVPTPTVFSLLASFAIAGALGGIVQGLTLNLGWWPGAWGGKAGLCAFVGCLLYRGLLKIKSLLLPSSA